MGPLKPYIADLFPKRGTNMANGTPIIIYPGPVSKKRDKLGPIKVVWTHYIIIFQDLFPKRGTNWPPIDPIYNYIPGPVSKKRDIFNFGSN